ncbi:hypothetical protein PR048_020280 [Dryococelus australis]|uniref:C2H2-type domain-containing protein n=1 Tax=Dryococelus australis TaxID=614101 RepID=A0ABQ9H5Y6_9NEOP|nr:hypothetical protein PR048_020280 [Dryococelus australis]
MQEACGIVPTPLGLAVRCLDCTTTIAWEIPVYKAFHCDNCDAVFTRSDHLYRHRKCKGSVCRSSGSEYKYCGKTFKTSSGIRQHEASNCVQHCIQDVSMGELQEVISKRKRNKQVRLNTCTEMNGEVCNKAISTSAYDMALSASRIKLIFKVATMGRNASVHICIMDCLTSINVHSLYSCSDKEATRLGRREGQGWYSIACGGSGRSPREVFNFSAVREPSSFPQLHPPTTSPFFVIKLLKQLAGFACRESTMAPILNTASCKHFKFNASSSFCALVAGSSYICSGEAARHLAGSEKLTPVRLPHSETPIDVYTAVDGDEFSSQLQGKDKIHTSAADDDSPLLNEAVRRILGSVLNKGHGRFLPIHSPNQSILPVKLAPSLMTSLSTRQGGGGGYELAAECRVFAEPSSRKQLTPRVWRRDVSDTEGVEYGYWEGDGSSFDKAGGGGWRLRG